ncbi:hypothetical protein M405DRAFT_864434 [Rhizopogon salebrosus TDB-379]|nr:hypothetical protein M405DRAFT_864434 [Rhizopogon salebrosus TDB-379]
MVDSWQDAEPTWDPLDDKGKVDEIYDAEKDSDVGVFNDGYLNGDDDDDY